jgi:hypothetical protein
MKTIMPIGLQIYTIIHVVLSLAGIGSGFAVFYGLLTDKRLEAWNRFFLVTTAATSVTGFVFPVDRFLPSHALGLKPDGSLAPKQQRRLTELMRRWWEARDSGNLLPAADQAELEAIARIALRGSADDGDR